MGDWILLLGGAIFLVLSALCQFRRDLVWKLYSLEPRWRRDNPERTAKWDEQTKRYAIYFLGIGLIAIVFGMQF